MTTTSYQGIIFPDRAESLRENTYAAYRVFLDFWQPLADQLRAFYEPVKDRGDTRILLVYGPQGGGKTMFARKLATDFESTPATGTVDPTRENLWHRISGGTQGQSARLDGALIVAARAATSLISVTDDATIGGVVIADDKDWLEKLVAKVAGDPARRWIILLDNAERGHFIQSLVDLPDVEFIRTRDQPETAFLAAQRFVGYARTKLRGCMFVVLTNSQPFAQTVDDSVNAQHKGMLVRTDLPLPGASEKETVVRVNTNRLNRVSYWYCLDRAGPTEKSAVYTALSGAETFPGSFAAVDTALRSSTRTGRRAKTCLLSLIVLSRDIDQAQLQNVGQVWRDEVSHGWLSIVNYDKAWASSILPATSAELLESEWMLRIVAIGEPFSKSLLSGDPAHEQQCVSLLNALKRAYGPGTHQSTLDVNRADYVRTVDNWLDTRTIDIEASFWRIGQRRSVVYEPILTRLLPGYNQTQSGFLSYRPDYVAAQFKPCSILAAGSADISRINDVIKRDAHVFEFTAMDQLTTNGVRSYLQQKLQNYVDIVREQ
jgi:hypothetical protein